jgi:flagellar motor switch protein FliN/FliY
METVSAGADAVNEKEELEKEELGNEEQGTRDIFGDIPVKIRAEIGTATLRMDDLRCLSIDSVIELDSKVDEAVKIYAGDVLIALGKVVRSDDDNYGIRIAALYNN